jgi:hypothetical protein
MVAPAPASFAIHTLKCILNYTKVRKCSSLLHPHIAQVIVNFTSPPTKVPLGTSLLQLPAQSFNINSSTWIDSTKDPRFYPMVNHGVNGQERRFMKAAKPPCVQPHWRTDDKVISEEKSIGQFTFIEGIEPPGEVKKRPTVTFTIRFTD